MDPWLPTLLSVAAVSLISLVGAAAGLRALSRHTVILTLVALAAGSLLGDALLHVLPESAELWGGFPAEVSLLVLAGFLLFFLLESVLRHQHAHGELLQEDHAHGHSHASHSHAGHAGHSHPRVAPFAWMNLAGDALHNFLDGIVLAAAYTVDLGFGLATTLAVALHEIPQELGDFAVLIKAGMKPRQALLANFLTALTAVAGAAVFLLLPFDAEALDKVALPLTAGAFLYIAAADLIPELHHHTGDRHIVHILAGFLAGIGLMLGLLFAFG